MRKLVAEERILGRFRMGSIRVMLRVCSSVAGSLKDLVSGYLRLLEDRNSLSVPVGFSKFPPSMY